MITHKAQLKILRKLLFKPNARFTDLNKATSLDSDHFNFHLNKLQEIGLIQKAGKYYRLTQSGLEFAGRIDLISKKLVVQPKVSVMVFVKRIKRGKKEVLLSERLTDPIKGLISCQTSKVLLGETLFEAAGRCLKKQTGLKGELSFVGVLDYQHYLKSELIESTIIHCFRVRNITGNIKYQTNKTKNFWIAFSEIKTLKHIYPGFDSLVGELDSKKLFFREKIVEEN